MMEFDQKAIQDAVVAKLAAEMTDDWDWREEARKMLMTRVDAAFKNGVAAVVDAAVADAVREGFDHAYSKSDSFGIQKGPQTTIRKELERLITDYWTAKVDRQGRPDSSSYGDKITRAEWHMIQVCGGDFEKNLKQEVVNIAAGFKDGLRAQLRGSMDKMLNDLFKVKSVQDAAEKLY